eukprot:355165-Chlamydomonas_euryale.AAC.2
MGSSSSAAGMQLPRTCTPSRQTPSRSAAAHLHPISLKPIDVSCATSASSGCVTCAAVPPPPPPVPGVPPPVPPAPAPPAADGPSGCSCSPSAGPRPRRCSKSRRSGICARVWALARCGEA